MNRLTKWNDKTEGAELISWDEEEWKDFMGSLDVPICTELSLAVDKLAEYEDAEEQGLLLRLPCKVGDTVWKISRFLIGSECGDLPDVWYRIDQDNFTLSMLGYYGKTIFLTKEEAEQALARMKEV